MAKFKVTLEELSLYLVEVEADDEDAACDAAEEAFVQSENINEFFVAVKERDVVSIVKA